MVTVEHEICLKNPSRERAVEVRYGSSMVRVKVAASRQLVRRGLR